jgi:hypothetical protein
MFEETDNYILLESLKKRYNEELETYQQLSSLINTKIHILKNNEIYQIKILDEEKSKLLFDIEKEKETIENNQNKIFFILKDINESENYLENNKPENINLDALRKDLNKSVSEINTNIRDKQNIKKNYELEKNKLSQLQQNEILKIKIDLKANQLSGQERENYYKSELSKLQEDYQNFIKRWDITIEANKDKKEEINETIDILNETLSEQLLDKQVERRKLSEFSKQWFVEKKKNKSYVKSLEEQINGHTNEKDILINNQNNWHSDVKNENTILIDEIKDIILSQESELNHIDTEISKIESNILDVDKKIQILNVNINKKQINDLNQIKWSLKISLGDLNQKRNILNDKYQYSLIDLNNATKKLNNLINNDPFKLEIKKLSNLVDKKSILINQIKKREKIIIEQDKKYLLENKDKFKKIKFEINKLNEKINSIDIDLKTINERFIEEKGFIMSKINSKEEELKDHYKYMNKFSEKAEYDINTITEKYKVSFDEINYLINKNIDDINEMKSQITLLNSNYNEILQKNNQSIDLYKRKTSELVKKKNLLSNNETILNDLKNKFSIKQKFYNDYMVEHESKVNEIKLNTLESIQKLHKSINSNELELKMLKNQIKNLEKTVIEDYIKYTSQIILSFDSEDKKEIENDLEKFENFIENGINFEDEIGSEINNFSVETIIEAINKELSNNNLNNDEENIVEENILKYIDDDLIKLENIHKNTIIDTDDTFNEIDIKSIEDFMKIINQQLIQNNEKINKNTDNVDTDNNIIEDDIIKFDKFIESNNYSTDEIYDLKLETIIEAINKELLQNCDNLEVEKSNNNIISKEICTDIDIDIDDFLENDINSSKMIIDGDNIIITNNNVIETTEKDNLNNLDNLNNVIEESEKAEEDNFNFNNLDNVIEKTEEDNLDNLVNLDNVDNVIEKKEETLDNIVGDTRYNIHDIIYKKQLIGVYKKIKNKDNKINNLNIKDLIYKNKLISTYKKLKYMNNLKK